MSPRVRMIQGIIYASLFLIHNRDRVRAERMPILLIDALLCGMTGTLLLLMLSGRLAYRPERPA